MYVPPQYNIDIQTKYIVTITLSSVITPSLIRKNVDSDIKLKNIIEELRKKVARLTIMEKIGKKPRKKREGKFKRNATTMLVNYCMKLKAQFK